MTQAEDVPTGSTAAVSSGLTDPSDPPVNPLPSDPAAIEAHITATRRRLESTLDELGARLKPKALAQQGVQGARRQARAAILTDEGSVRVERVAAVALAALTVLALVVRRRRHRR